MDIRKTVKKIAALTAGATMLGATIMGAMALDLSDYPAPFVTDGVFDGKIVVGAAAATSDVAGAIDIAASLQAEAKTTTDVEIPGAAGMATVVGDSAEFKTGTDIPDISEELRNVKQTFTATELDALKEGVFDTGLSSSPVKQYLKFDNASISVVYEVDENNDDQEGDYLKVTGDGTVFEYHLEFTEGAISEIGTSNQLDDLENEVLTILGAPFTIVEAKRSSGDTIEITMLGGEVADVLRDGETKTYTIDGVDYEVTAVFIDSGTSQSAKLSVDGVMTKELTEGKTQVLSDDVTIGVQEILTNQREGLVEFFLGANKIKLTDSDYTTTTYAAGTVKVGTETVDDAWLIVKATNQTANTELKVNYIKYKLIADDNKWVPAGEGVKAYLQEPEGMLTNTWDILYAGLTDTGISPIKFNGLSDHSYKLEFENLNGDAYNIPLLTDKSSSVKGWRYGDYDDDLIFMEAVTASAAQAVKDNATWISDDDYFVVADGTNANKGDKAITNVMRYKSISTSESTVTFEDLAGDTLIVSFTGTVGSDATGQLIVAGATHDFYVGNTSGTAYEKYALAMDLDASGAITANDEVNLVAKGGAIIDLGTQTFNVTGGASENTSEPATLGYTNVNITVTPDSSRFDEARAGEQVVVTLSTTATANVLTGTVNGTLWEDPDDDKYSYRMTRYGGLVQKYTPSTSNSLPEVTVEYPLSQKYGQVFVAMGSVEVKSGEGTGGGSVTTSDVNPIAVGLAVMDTNAPAIGSEPMIVVGGPCANIVAKELMGNPENCGEGFAPGKAIIKLWADKNALLVAGYEAQETLGASYVLADYEDYALSGTEMEVSVADLSTITVTPVV